MNGIQVLLYQFFKTKVVNSTLKITDRLPYYATLRNNRLNIFNEENNIINEAQAAFRKGYSTTDHIFTLHNLIDIMKKRKKK